jgi:hypothetical protein
MPADELRERLSSPPEPEDEPEDDDLADLPPQADPGNVIRTSTEVLGGALPACRKPWTTGWRYPSPTGIPLRRNGSSAPNNQARSKSWESTKPVLSWPASTSRSGRPDGKSRGTAVLTGELMTAALPPCRRRRAWSVWLWLARRR